MLKLFWIFFKISLFTFGGGYAMIPALIQEMSANGYLTEEMLFQFIGLSESTPGPFAINIATFVGYENYGVLGAILTTLGAVLPSFIIISIIAFFSKKLFKLEVFRKLTTILQPAIIGFIFAAGLSILIKAILGDFTNFVFNWQALVIFITVGLMALIFRKKMKPIFIILASGLLGLILYTI